MVERIASFLGDNALTRGWAETMDRHVITPVELQFVKEMPPKDRFNAFASRFMGDDARLNDQGIEFLDAVRTGEGDTPEKRTQMLQLFDALAAQGGEKEAVESRVLGGLYGVASLAKGEGLHRGLNALAPRNGTAGYTELGRQMRQLGLGSPVAAYSAVTAGGAMGTAAAMEAYDWWLSQQQQAEKESQLPLQ
jgi:hypothetical protein